MLTKGALVLLSALAVLAGGCSSDENTATIFQIDVENISTLSSFTAADGSPLPVVFSPALWVLAGAERPVFTVGQPASPELETFAEDADPGPLADLLLRESGVSLVGVVNQTATGQGLLSPGEKYSFFVAAPQGERLSLLMTYLQANDVFAATADAGVPLFDPAGNPRSGDITGDFALYDAGTEVNQAPGLGPDQVPRQTQPNSGASEQGVVAPVNDGFPYPALGAVLRVTITPTQQVDY